jgi:transcriptional regulator of nitric oxide reductase
MGGKRLNWRSAHQKNRFSSAASATVSLSAQSRATARSRLQLGFETVFNYNDIAATARRPPQRARFHRWSGETARAASLAVTLQVTVTTWACEAGFRSSYGL